MRTIFLFALIQIALGFQVHAQSGASVPTQLFTDSPEFGRQLMSAFESSLTLELQNERTKISQWLIIAPKKLADGSIRFFIYEDGILQSPREGLKTEELNLVWNGVAGITEFNFSESELPGRISSAVRSLRNMFRKEQGLKLQDVNSDDLLSVRLASEMQNVAARGGHVYMDLRHRADSDKYFLKLFPAVLQRFANGDTLKGTSNCMFALLALRKK